MLVFTSSVNKSEIYSQLLKKNKIPHTVLNAKNHEREAEIIADAGKLKSVIITTSISGRGVDIKLGGKKVNNNQEEIINEKNKIKTLGGLFVLGTERMESRRVDNQARGRSGRQGDEGGSIFYVSLEDDLMRIFGSESMTNVLEKLGLKDGESIDHPWINKALERAQQKVESRNFDIRKTLLKFDNVLNDQRQVIFNQRKDVMNSNSIFDYSNNFLDEVISELIKYKNTKDFETQIRSLLGKSLSDGDINDLLQNDEKVFKKKIANIFSEKRKDRIGLIGNEQATEVEKRILLQSIDINWKLHIQYLEQLRQVIGLRSYGQRDPLIEYKKEAFSLFENLLIKIKNDLIKILINITLVNTNEKSTLNEKQNKIEPKYIGKKMGRNEPCYCGSKKKFKHCCGRL